MNQLLEHQKIINTSFDNWLKESSTYFTHKGYLNDHGEGSENSGVMSSVALEELCQGWKISAWITDLGIWQIWVLTRQEDRTKCYWFALWETESSVFVTCLIVEIKSQDFFSLSLKFIEVQS